MKKDKIKQMNVIRTISSLLLCCFFLYVAWVWGNRRDWVHFGIFVAGAIIIAMWFPAIIICRKLDERFERLEKLLDKQSQSKSEK